MKVAVYPGSFDPFTNGHLDIVKRSLEVVDHLLIAVLKNSSKKNLFTIEKRLEIVKEVFEDDDRVKVDTFSGLLVDFCRERNIKIVVRGLRVVSDFDYEHAIYLMNNKLLKELETVFFMSKGENAFISSSIVKEVASYGGNVEDQVPPTVHAHMMKTYENNQ